MLLIVEGGGLGSILRATSIAQSVKNSRLGARVYWLTHRRGIELLDHVRAVDRAFDIDLHAHTNLLETIQFRDVLCLESDEKFLPFASKLSARYRHGFISDRFGRPVHANSRSKALLRLQVDDRARKSSLEPLHAILLKTLKLREMSPPYVFEICDQDRRWARGRLSVTGTDSATVVALNIGASERHRAKRPALALLRQTITELLRSLANARIVILAGPDEADQYAALESEFRTNTRVILPGRENSLGQFASLIEQADVLITADTLAFHLGASLGRPTIVLAGPQPLAELWRPPHVSSVSLNLDCAPCFAATEQNCANPERLKCMASIEPMRIVDAVTIALTR